MFSADINTHHTVERQLEPQLVDYPLRANLTLGTEKKSHISSKSPKRYSINFYSIIKINNRIIILTILPESDLKHNDFEPLSV